MAVSTAYVQTLPSADGPLGGHSIVNGVPIDPMTDSDTNTTPCPTAAPCSSWSTWSG